MDNPTSRKKYYLQCNIRSEWRDASLVPDFLRHVYSATSIMVRDIFMGNANRGGCFSVQSKGVAEKLIASVVNNNVSCRGRKPHAELIPVSPDNHRLRLGNLNAVICKNDFLAWCKTLHCDAFDIQLFPTLIGEPFPTHMIVAFDTIDAAIAVKQKLSNAPFRQCVLYFTHWHVPRRSQYPEVRHTNSNTPISMSLCSSAAASPSNQSAYSGHGWSGACTPLATPRTTATATPRALATPRTVATTMTPHSTLALTRSPSRAYSTRSGRSGMSGGSPLYLRDASVPAPPRRAAPQPPAYRVRVDINIGDQREHRHDELCSSSHGHGHGHAKAVIQAASSYSPAHAHVQLQTRQTVETVDTVKTEVVSNAKPASSTPSTETSSNTSQTSCLPKSQSSCSDLEDGLEEMLKMDQAKDVTDKTATAIDKTGTEKETLEQALDALIDEEVRRFPFDYVDELIGGDGHGVGGVGGKHEQPLQQQQPQPSHDVHVVHSLQTELDSHKLYVHHLERMNKYYVEQLNTLKVQQQGMGEKYEYLYRQYAGMKRCNAVLAWNTHEIVQWILQLENGRFYKYKSNLVTLTQHYQINGAMLSRFKMAELYKMGVSETNDQQSLLRHIQALFAM